MSNMLSNHWLRIQGSLFPCLRETLGPLNEKQQQLIVVLEMSRIDEFVSVKVGGVGRPEDDRRSIAIAFVAKAVYNIPQTNMLIERLHSDITLRRLCGWEKKSDIPSEATFSRAFAEFADIRLPEQVHEALIDRHYSDRLVGHISRDSTEIESREKPVKKPTSAIPVKKKRGRPKKGELRQPKEPTRLEKQVSQSLDEMIADLPKSCDVGCKKNSKGFKESWIGYKFHGDVADGGVFINCILTSASLHDSQVALPLAEMTNQRVTNLYDLMDAAYDSPIIRTHSQSLGHVALIDHNPRRKSEKIQMPPAQATRYHERTTVERSYGQLKDGFGARYVRVKGNPKVMTHLMFGVVALTVEQLIRMLC